MPLQKADLQHSGAPGLAGETQVAEPKGFIVEGDSGGKEKEASFDFSDLLQVWRRRQKPFLITFLLITTVQTLRTLNDIRQNPVYVGNFALLISDPMEDANGSGGGGGGLASVALNSFSVDLPTVVQVLQSRSVLDPVFETLKREGVSEKKFPSISLALTKDGSGAGQSRGVMSVEAKGADPQALKRGLELTEQAYVAWATSQRQERLRDGLRFLQQQEPQLRSSSKRLQLELQQFRQANKVLQPTEAAQALASRLEAVQQQRLALQGEKRQLEELRADVASGRQVAWGASVGGGGGSQSGSASGGGSESANLPSHPLQDELRRLDQEIAEAEANLQPGSAVLTSLKASRASLLPRVQGKQMEAVDKALRQNANTLSTNQAQIALLKRQFQNQPELLGEFEDLQKRLQIADGNLDNHLRAREQFKLEMAQRNSPWKVLSASQVSDVPVGPSLSKVLLQGLMAGLVSGAGVAFLRERLDDVFHSPQEVSEELNKPMLGHMPYVAVLDGPGPEKLTLINELDQQNDQVGDYQRFFYQESLRNIYTSLRFLSTDKPLKSVAITSTLPSEGKSILSLLLAKTVSEMGRRVLLVDGDLRKPQIHRRLGLDNLRGLSNLITEEAADWREVVQQVPSYPGWSVICAGRLPPDPPRLLGSERMDQIVRELAGSGEFDLILYDTPPALGLSDAALIAQHLEGFIMLVSLKRVGRRMPAQSLERMRAAGAPLLGVVTNDRRLATDKNLIYGYGYGYGRYGTEATYRHYSGSETAETPKPATIRSQLQRAGKGVKGLGRNVSRWLDR